MTLTNNIVRIQELADGVKCFVDDKKYHLAHSYLDDIMGHVYKLRRHIEHLQNVSDFCPRPEGGD